MIRINNLLLSISILLLAATLLLDKGPQDLLLDLLPLWLLGSMLPAADRTAMCRDYALALTGVTMAFWLPALVHTPDGTRNLQNLLLFLLLALGVCRSGSLWLSCPRLWRVSLLLLLIVPALIHLLAVICQHNNTGMFKNPHYLSLALIMIIPVTIFWLHRGQNTPLLNTLLLGALLLDFYLLLLTHSRPAWLALAGSCLLLLPAMHARMRLLAGSGLLLIPLILYQLDWFQFAERIDDLLLNLAREERVAIWLDSWKMQMSSTWPEWLIGHGYGAYYKDFMAFSRYHNEVDFYSPHNFLLEILYSCGLWGVTILSTALALLFRQLIHFARPANRTSDRPLAMLLLTLLVAHLLHTFLTLPLLAKETVLYMAFIAGTTGWLTDRSEQSATAA